MLIVDTNVISELMAPDCDPLVNRWGDSRAPYLFTTAICCAEIRWGVEQLPEGKRKSRLKNAVDHVFTATFKDRVLAFDQVAAEFYGELTARLRRRGDEIGTADRMIASICLSHRAPIVTRNTKHFEPTGLKIINPWTDLAS